MSCTVIGRSDGETVATRTSWVQSALAHSLSRHETARVMLMRTDVTAVREFGETPDSRSFGVTGVRRNG